MTILDSFFYTLGVKADTGEVDKFKDAMKNAHGHAGNFSGVLHKLSNTLEDLVKTLSETQRSSDYFGEHLENAGEQARATGDEVEKLNKKTSSFTEGAKTATEKGTKTLHPGLVMLKYGATAAIGAFTGLVASVATTENHYEKLAYAAQRAGSSIKGMQTFAYGISQQGGTQEGAISSLEGLGNFLQTSGAGGVAALRQAGVQATDGSGHARDSSALMRDLGRSFQSMEKKGVNYATIQAQASVFGIDPTTLQAMLRGVDQFSNQLDGVYAKVGLNSDKVSKSAIRFMDTFRELRATIGAAKDSLMAQFGDELSAEMKTIQKDIVDNFGSIKAFVSEVGSALMTGFRVGLFLFKGFVAVVRDLMGWFKGLSSQTKTFLEVIGGFGVAFAVLGGPITLVSTLAAGIAALYLDYKQWKAGAKSFIDWDKWKPDIDNVLAGIEAFKDAFKNIYPVIKRYMEPVVDFLKNTLIRVVHMATRGFVGFAKALKEITSGNISGALSTIKDAFSDNWNTTKDIAGNLVGTVSTEASHLHSDFQAPLTTEQENNNRQKVFDFFAGKASETNMAGLIGNLVQESGLNPYKSNDNSGGHYGIAQWSNYRAGKVLKGTGIDVIHPDADPTTDTYLAILATDADQALSFHPLTSKTRLIR